MDAEGSDDDAAESGEDAAWLLRAWRHVRRGVAELLAQEATAKDAEAADEEEKQEQQKVATACGDTACAARPFLALACVDQTAVVAVRHVDHQKAALAWQAWQPEEVPVACS